MPVYCFFKKGEHVNALEKSDTESANFLQEWGYSKQSEELDAANTHCALAQYLEIQAEGRDSEYEFSTGAAFVALIISIIAVVDWFFL